MQALLLQGDTAPELLPTAKHLVTWSAVGVRVLLLAVAPGRLILVPAKSKYPITCVTAKCPSRDGARDQVGTVVDAVLVGDVVGGATTRRLLCFDLLAIEVRPRPLLDCECRVVGAMLR